MPINFENIVPTIKGIFSGKGRLTGAVTGALMSFVKIIACNRGHPCSIAGVIAGSTSAGAISGACATGTFKGALVSSLSASLTCALILSGVYIIAPFFSKAFGKNSEINTKKPKNE